MTIHTSEEVICPRVLKAIECEQCGYPYSEAQYQLTTLGDGERLYAVCLLTQTIFPDPGHIE